MIVNGEAVRIAKELESERGIALNRWHAVMPGLRGDNRKKLMGMSDEPRI